MGRRGGGALRRGRQWLDVIDSVGTGTRRVFMVLNEPPKEQSEIWRYCRPAPKTMQQNENMRFARRWTEEYT